MLKLRQKTTQTMLALHGWGAVIFGLLLYWVTSNILTLAQQKYLYSRHPQLRAAIDEEKAKKAAEAEAKARG